MPTDLTPERLAELRRAADLKIDFAHPYKRDMLMDAREVYALLDHIEAVTRERDGAQKRLDEFDCCMCGSRMSDHNVGSGHSPVSIYDYRLDQAEQSAKTAEARLAEAERLVREALQHWLASVSSSWTQSARAFLSPKETT